MDIPSIKITPNSISGKATVTINGHQCGEMWMTERGCCYRHTHPALNLTTNMVDMIVAVMRGAEALASEEE